METLVLNQAYWPVSTVSWRDAVVLWYLQKAEILEEYEDVMLRSWKLAMNMPAVVRLYHFVTPPRKQGRYQPFTRRNVWLRDNGTCQYCGMRLSLSAMTFDHVYPKSSGRCQTGWTNIVCACTQCNNRKRNRTPEQANMTLLREPVAPKRLEREPEIMHRLRGLKRIPHKSWQNYIYWNVELEED